MSLPFIPYVTLRDARDTYKLAVGDTFIVSNGAEMYRVEVAEIVWEPPEATPLTDPGNSAFQPRVVTKSWVDPEPLSPEPS